MPGSLASSTNAEAALWNSLSDARDAREFCRAWLAIQCGIISGATAGLLLLDDGEGDFSSAAAWPDARRDLAYLTETAQQTLSQRRSFVQRPAASHSKTVHVGQPVEWAGRLKGVIVVDLVAAKADLASAIRQLRWGIGWLEALFARPRLEQDAARLAPQAFPL